MLRSQGGDGAQLVDFETINVLGTKLKPELQKGVGGHQVSGRMVWGGLGPGLLLTDQEESVG